MDLQNLTKVLRELADGEMSVEAALGRLQKLPFSDLGYARVDHHRALRVGWPEVIFGENKCAAQIIGIAREVMAAEQDLLVTRVSADKAALVRSELAELHHSELARTLSLRRGNKSARLKAPVAVVTAGTSDLNVAEEAVETLQLFGERVDRVYDVGVAGLHRLFERMPLLERASAIICLAGMEGALPSVLGGLVRCPIVAVPTSVGYGTSLQGLTALFAMLTGCASGVAVVNIDNGFGAAMTVLRMTQLVSDERAGAGRDG
ncbi:MAG TPA: nickel pincer cofactor biosynthesis protein LarB [Polyangiaceae bacterium]|nr:nickel pincer cofactor biosynthesis protein LarB [Polyangiaceae bacterium]